MPFPPKRDHRITLEAARESARRYRESAGPDAQRGGMFPREVFEALLAPDGCAGIRLYYGESENGERELIAFSVDSDGNDMTSAQVFEYAFPCPPYCGGGGD
ncbi:MAG: hypothetical protein M3403_08215 [Gemmatimonadota bacterium]|nr:hypothetical protein [Gemmatimonadota bacterium]